MLLVLALALAAGGASASVPASAPESAPAPVPAPAFAPAPAPAPAPAADDGAPLAATLPAVAYSPLALGVPQLGFVSICNGTIWSCPSYYTYAAAPGSGAFRIIVSQYSGSGATDLFVSDSSNALPGPPPALSSNWSSVSYAPLQIVDVPASVTAACVPAMLPNSTNSSGLCVFYASVAPFAQGLLLYSIVVTNTSSGAPIALVDGEPQTNFVAAGSVNLYSFNATPSSSFHSLTISTQSFSGDADVYVTLNGNGASPPGPGNSDYSSLDGSGNLIYIPFASSKCYTVGVICSVSIAVGYSQTDFLYSITAASSQGVSTLANAVAQSGYVSVGAYAYFNFTPGFTGNFTIFCTALTGDPDLYVSTSGLPSNSSYMWGSATDVDEVIRITTTDPKYQPPPASYLIAVYGYSGNVSFSVLAQMDGPNTTTALADGVPQAGIAPPHNFAYFSFQMASRYPLGNPGLDIGVIPRVGNCDVYVSNLTTTTVDGAGVRTVTPVFPKPVCLFYGTGGVCYYWGVDNTTYTWSSAMQGSQNFVSLSGKDLYANESFVIGVLATTRDPQPGQEAPPTLFTIIAATGATTLDLPMGQAVPGVVTARAYKYYRLTTTAWGMDIVVAGSRKSGGVSVPAAAHTACAAPYPPVPTPHTPPPPPPPPPPPSPSRPARAPRPAQSFDIFVAEGGLPSNGNSTWNSTSRGGGIIGNKYAVVPFLQLSQACQNQLQAGAPCTLYVAVQGSVTMGPGVECLYSLVAQISGSQVYPFVLSDGAPVYTFIPAPLSDYFYGLVNVPPQRSIFVVVQNLVGSTSLYLNIGNSSKTFWVPGGPQPDVYTPDMGGYERVDIFPPNAWPHSSLTDDGAGAAYRTELAESAAAVEQGRYAKEAVPGALDDARIVARLASGGVVIEVPVRAETVPVVDGGREVGAQGRYSATATRAHPENLASDPSPESALAGKFRYARAAEAAARARVEPAAATAEALGAPLDGPLDAPLDAPPVPPRYDLWCTGCSLFLTVSATVDSQVAVSFTAGSTYQTLQNGLPVEGYSPRGDFSYYAFAATDPLQDVVISLQPVFGEVDAYVSVQIPTAPNFMPGHFNNAWQLHPWTGQYSLTINHTDVNFCRPRDGSAPGTPCVFLIGVFARNNETATYTISASADGSQITPLLDGAPFASSVLEGQLQYFQFTVGYPVPSTQLVWTNLFGAVSSYVTNQYVAGVSAQSMLPGPGSHACQWVGTNFSGMGMAPGDPCFSPLQNVYTIGVLGNSGFAGLVSQFVVTASVTGDATRLIYGVPTTNIFLPKTSNLLFTFEVLDLSQDLVIASTPTYGEVGLLVAPLDRVNGTVPGCSMACSGCQVICANYTWFLPSYGSSPVLYINASDPCNVPVPASTGGPAQPVIVSPSCNRYSLRPGRYWAALYGFGTISETSLAVVQNGQPMVLADGQPQDLQTGPVTLCPGQRDGNFSGNCVLNMRPSTVTYGNQMSVLSFRIPYSARALDAYVIIDRLCNGNATGLCGQPLHAFVVACAPTGIPTYNRRCDADSPFPTASNAQLDFVVSGVQGSARVNYNLCQNSAFNLGDCLFYVAVYPVCKPGGGPPGVGCPPSLFRATFASDAGVERVPNDCLARGSVCTLPEAGGLVGSTKRYLAYAGDTATTLTLTAQACSGAVAMYYCDAFNGNCQPVSFPGPTNSDLPPVSSSAATQDAATFAQVPIAGSLFYLGVRPIALGPGAQAPTFQVVMRAGSGPLLVANPVSAALNVSRDASGTSATVSFGLPYLQAPGQLSRPATFATYLVYAFPGAQVPQYYNLDTPCGNDDAWAAPVASQLRVFATSPRAVLQGLSPNLAYTISVVATCSALTCMPNDQLEQRAAYLVAYLPVVPPSPSPAPPAPAAAPAAAAFGPGAAAGVSIAAILLVGGGAYFAARRAGLLGGGGGAAGAAARYTPSGADGMFSGSSSSSTTTYTAPTIQGESGGPAAYSAL